MKEKGSITIYLSLILLSMLLLICIITEAGRMNFAQSKAKSATYMAAESVMAGYGRQVYEDYGVLLVWENESLDNQLERYIQDNINMADLSDTGLDFMTTDVVNVDTGDVHYVTDEGGEEFAEQIVSYTKYAGVMETAETLIKKFNKYSEASEADTPETNNVTDIVDDISDELQELVQEINEKTEKLKDTEELEEKAEAAGQALETVKSEDSSDEKNVKDFLKKYKKLMTKLDKKSDDAKSIINKMDSYEEKKELFLLESDYTYDEEDYVEKNKKILENIEDEIEENKELNVSDVLEGISKNVQIAETSLNLIEKIIGNMQSLTVNDATEEDKKNYSIYESASALLNDSVIWLALGDDTSDVSDNAIESSNLPSQKKSEADTSTLDKIKNKACMAVYVQMMFGNYSNPKDETSLKYEMEYIINGKTNDKDNLAATIEKITGVRNVMNLAYLITDSTKMAEISSVAFSAATAVGLPFLEPVIKAVLTEAWALAESVCDARELYQGEEIPIKKTSATWNTSLTSLLGSATKPYKGDNGLDYEAYLEILLLTVGNEDCIYRIMDLIQVNTQKRYNSSFMMSECVQSIDVKVEYQTQPVFSALNFVVGALSDDGAYNYRISCRYSY